MEFRRTAARLNKDNGSPHKSVLGAEMLFLKRSDFLNGIRVRSDRRLGHIAGVQCPAPSNSYRVPLVPIPLIDIRLLVPNPPVPWAELSRRSC